MLVELAGGARYMKMEYRPQRGSTVWVQQKGYA